MGANYFESLDLDVFKKGVRTKNTKAIKATALDIGYKVEKPIILLDLFSCIKC